MTFISYLRVSTDRQGATGYGIDAQRLAISRFGDPVCEFVEVESGRKSAKGRPELTKALAECKKTGATLIVGKIDRLARDVRFFLEILDDYGVEIRFAEFSDINPKSDEGRMILIGMANFAEFEGRRIGARVKAGLAAAKARGVKLGGYKGADLTKAREASVKSKKAAARTFASSVYLTVKNALDLGGNLTAASAILNGQGVKTSAGCSWCPKSVSRVMAVSV